MSDPPVTSAESAAAALGNALGHAAWLSDEILLVHGVADARCGVMSQPAARVTDVEARTFTVPGGTILAAALSPGLLQRPGTLLFVDPGAAAALVADGRSIAAVVADLRTFLREGPAGYDAATRTALLGFLATLGVEYGLSESLSEGLHDAREALRERRPVVVDDPRISHGVHVEQLQRIDDTGFYLRGRAWDHVAPLITLAAISPEGERVELLERAFRPGRGRADFAAWFRTATPSRREEGWVVEAASSPARAVETDAALTPGDARAILADAALELPSSEALHAQQIRPAIARLQELRRAVTTICDIQTYGAVSRRPAVSLVVSLGRHVALLEHQIAHFSTDPALRECELLYVLDDLEQREHLHELAGGLFELYALPFRVAELSRDADLAISCNLAASVASGRRLVFLHADVVPDRAGWLDALVDVCEAEPDAGAVGAKLLYEDDGIEHAGVEYRRADGAAPWQLEHRFRGMHRSLPAANLAARVPAVSAACLMVDASLFRDVGGMSTEYADHGYEGPDLCRRLEVAGRRTWYAPQAELYHLDSFEEPEDVAAARYDRWLHSRLWGGSIEDGAA